MTETEKDYRARIGHRAISSPEPFWKIVVGAFFSSVEGENQGLKFKINWTHYWDYKKAQVFRQNDVEERVRPCTVIVHSDALPIEMGGDVIVFGEEEEHGE